MRIFLKLFKESILFAFHALSVNKLRTFLSLLGISIGIFAIISVFTAVDSMEDNVQDSVKSLGENVIYVQKWPWGFGNEGGEYPWWKYWQRPLPGVKEMQELKDRTTTIDYFSFEAYVEGKTLKYRSNSVENTTVALVSHDFDKIKSFELADGRYFTEMESGAGRPVTVIGATIAAGLFENENPVGNDITVMGRKVNVIGVFKKEGKSLLETSNDDAVIIPLNYGRNLINIKNDNVGPFIKAKVKANVANAQAMDDLKSAMRSIRRLRPIEEDNFALNESNLLTKNVAIMFDTISMFGAIIGVFSVIVGGFGIANIMFVSVRERTSQIGIQKALGAKNYFILLQFLIEAVVLCIIGGIIGLLIIFILATIATKLMDFNMTLTLENILWGLGISGIIGVVSGFVPAYIASQLDPVEAIRSNG
jgi:putative ABC transport system permease protein